MKTTKRFLLMSMMLLAALTMPLTGNAKWSKASSDFVHGNVRVTVIDRHKEIGAAYDTYGYAIYDNTSNDNAVKVDWVAYGVLKKGQRLVRLDEGSFTIPANDGHKEVYNYGAGKFTYRDFESYVVAIDVTTIKDKSSSATPSDTPKTQAPTVDGKPTARGIDLSDDKIADEVMRMSSEGRNFTQEDYRAVINWLSRTFKNDLQPVYLAALRAEEQGNYDEIDRLHKKNQDLWEKWSQLGFFIDEADNAGLLDTSNHKALQELKDYVDSFDN